MYKILTFDGGGIRGLVTLGLLKGLQAGVPDLVKNADFVAGTSTGGIIALGLAAGKSVDDLTNLYLNNGRAIFDSTWLRDIVDMGNIIGAKYDNAKLKQILQAALGNPRLGDLGKKVLIPSFQLDNGADHPLDDGSPDPGQRTWKPVFFHNFPGVDSDGGESLLDVAMSTSAAPTYFPTYINYVDGGVVANNPSMAALAQTQDGRAEIEPTRPALSDIRLLSLGTGTVLSYIAGQNLDWGDAQWVKPLLNLLLDASMGIADFQCQQLLRNNYQRLAPVFPSGTNIALDDWQRSQDLLDFANGVDLTTTIQWLKNAGW